MLHRVQTDGVPEVAVTTPAAAAICTATLPNSMESRGRAIVLTRPPAEQPVHNKADFWKDLSCLCQHKGFAKGHDRMLTQQQSSLSRMAVWCRHPVCKAVIPHTVCSHSDCLRQ